MCHEKFYPDYRQKGRQYSCARTLCQSKRRNLNNRDWYQKNPDCLEYQRHLTREWFLDHPGYQNAWRLDHPETVPKNRRDTKRRMRGIRSRSLFEKTNSIFSEALGNKRDKCFLNARSGWVHLRLKKQTRYTEYKRLCEDLAHIHPKKVRPFGERIYDLGPLFEARKAPP
jgi:hypothetical protein